MDSNRLTLMMMEDKIYGDYNVLASNQAVGQTPIPKEPTTQVEEKIWKASGSLEGLHGTYHGLIGGFNPSGGHMSRVPVAAFDPIFVSSHAKSMSSSYMLTNSVVASLVSYQGWESISDPRLTLTN
jgi:hypothetical protein